MRLAFACLCLAIAALGSARSASAAVNGCMPASIRHTLNQIEARFGAVQVVSAFRRNARVARSGRRSLHADCRAVDFNPPRGKYAAVVSWLRGNHSGGLGTYSGRFHHIHIDNGGKYAWHDGSSGHSRVAWAGSGLTPRRAAYGGRATRVAGYLRRGRGGARLAMRGGRRGGARYAYRSGRGGVRYAQRNGRARFARAASRQRYALRTRAGQRIAQRLDRRFARGGRGIRTAYRRNISRRVR